ncbi:MAG: head GIN domain-containing protein [Bacteroidales bacterium]
MKTKLMKKMPSIFFITIILFANSVFATSISENPKKEIKVGEFTKISLAIPADLYLSQGDENEVYIDASDQILEKIEAEVKNGTLNIQFEKWYNYRGFSDIKIYITVKQIEKLSLAGSGKIISQSPIKADKIGLFVSGSGDIEIDELIAANVGVMITGSGDIKIQGKSTANSLDANITGSGDLESEEMEFNKADLTITGSGSINANVVDEIDALITGSGRIYYKGNPLINANITGSGKIRSSN